MFPLNSESQTTSHVTKRMSQRDVYLFVLPKLQPESASLLCLFKKEFQFSISIDKYRRRQEIEGKHTVRQTFLKFSYNLSDFKGSYKSKSCEGV